MFSFMWCSQCDDMLLQLSDLSSFPPLLISCFLPHLHIEFCITVTSTSSCTQENPPQTQIYASTPNARLHRKGKRLLHPLYLTFLNLVPCFNPCIRKNCRSQKEPVDYVYGLCDNVRTVSTVQRVTYAATPLMHMSANVSGWKFGGCIFSAACILCHLRCFCLFEDGVGMIWFGSRGWGGVDGIWSYWSRSWSIRIRFPWGFSHRAFLPSVNGY